MIFNKLLGIKTKFRKGNENWRMRRLFDQERPVITVAQDGSGDFQKIEDAIRIITELEGGTIIIKKGTYNYASTDASYGLIIPNNTKITGEGLATIIVLPDKTYGIKFVNSENIIIEDVKIVMNSTEGTALIRLEDSTNLKLNRILFTGTATKFSTGFHEVKGTITKYYFTENVIDDLANTYFSEAWLFFGSYSDTIAINELLLKDNILNTVSCFAEGVENANITNARIVDNICTYGFYQAIFKKSKIGGNNMGTSSGNSYITLLSGSTLTRISGNYGYTINLNAGSTYNNVCNNTLDVAVTNAGTGNTVANNTIY